VAIIGLGGMGGHHAEAVQAAGHELVGGAEIFADKGKAWGARFGVEALYKDYERMLDAVRPDIVIISTQTPQHYGAVLAAAERGVHVFCEKPTALNLVEADEMVEACERHNVRFAINHIKRASAYNRLVLDRIASGQIGQLVRMRAYDKGGRKAGNSLMEMGTHLYDWVRLFGGDMEWAQAHLVQLDGRESTAADIKHTQEVHPHDRDAGLVLGERAFASFRFKSGVHAEVDFLGQERTDDSSYGLDLIGTEGRIALRYSVGTAMYVFDGSHHPPSAPWEPVRLEMEEQDGEQRESTEQRLPMQCRMLEDLIAAIEEGREPYASGRDGRDCLEMIHATWESHRQGRRVLAPLMPRQHPLERWRREEGLS
jgi:predicted dehydrogenase